jgi:hypothetical protein
MRTIKLSGKHAVGRFAQCIVDDDDYDRLSRYAWKAKPNGNGTHVYAVRNVMRDGVCTMVRMHRAVIGYEGELDVDHINGDTMDNRRGNLRAVPRAWNVRNTEFYRSVVGPYTPWPPKDRLAYKTVAAPKPQVFGVCAHCAARFVKNSKHHLYCCEACKDAARQFVPMQKVCQGCAGLFTANRGNKIHCSAKCKNASNRRKAAHAQPAKGTPQPQPPRVRNDREIPLVAGGGFS